MPRTEYDKPFYSRQQQQQDQASSKDYTKKKEELFVDFGMGSGDQELPSETNMIQHTPQHEQGTMKARMDNQSMQKFSTTQSDRSDLGMSNASSVGMPGLGTIGAGINIPDPQAFA